ncbi:MAG: sugar phosphate isomerase/epimerase [Candidatus Woesebacteria bacterium]|nr:MAG: sugar phosphate isomerase/epimerase [Candidatus Woesebacteria bacterium]
MKIAISNLAWDHSEDSKVLKLLQKYNINAIEIAASKIWQDPVEVTDAKINKCKNFWKKNGIEIVATTSLLFGHPELQIFADRKAKNETFSYLSKMIELSVKLGAKAMVFGSPKNRVTNGKSKKEVEKISIEFFGKISKIARKRNIYFGIEPNPPLYGTDFINTTDEAIKLVKKVNNSNFCVHLDTSTMTINQENYLKTIIQALPYTHHYHISEPGLKPIPTEETDHKKVSNALKNSGYKDWVSIEMPLGPDIKHLEQIEKTLKFVNEVYAH